MLRRDAARADGMTADRAVDIELSQLRRLEIASFAEATTLLLLLGVAVPLKHLGGWDMGVRVMGPVHGLAFVAYIWTVVQTVAGGGWSRGETARLLLVALVPFGGFFNLPLLFRKASQLRAMDLPA
jgi:integral membrane protein